MTYTITAISQAKTNSERVNIELNGKFWIGLGKNDLIALKLTQGKEISELEKQEIERIAVNGKLVNRALNYMQRRPRSVGEVRDYLVRKKDVEQDDAESVINYLQEKELLSDEKFAEWYINYKASSGVNGVNKIKAELMKKKVNKKVIDMILERFFANDEFKDEQFHKLEEYATKIKGTIKAKDSFELKAKLTQRLMARGFKYEDIKKILKE